MKWRTKSHCHELWCPMRKIIQEQNVGLNFLIFVFILKCWHFLLYLRSLSKIPLHLTQGLSVISKLNNRVDVTIDVLLRKPTSKPHCMHFSCMQVKCLHSCVFSCFVLSLFKLNPLLQTVHRNR